MANRKNTDVSGTRPEETASSEARSAHEAPNKPLWSRQVNRVSGSVWKQDRQGEVRYTLSVSRGWYDEREKKWKHYHTYDRRDIADVVAVCREAEQKMLELDGMTQVVGED